MITTVVIDFDDTLCLTEAACFELENETLTRIGREPMSRDIHIATWGKPLFEAILERSPGVDVEEFKRAYHPIIQEYTESGKLDAIPAQNFVALDTLTEQGYNLMILTSRTLVEVTHLLEPDHGLTSRIKKFYHKDNTQFHKPDPRVFDELLQENDLTPNECVYVGDSLSDAVATKSAGMHFVACLESGLREKQDFNEHNVDEFINTFAELPGAIGALTS